MRPTSASGALVTGGARGIGRAIVEELAASGHDVVVADVATAEGLPARWVELDVTDVEAVREVVARVDAETPLRTVVNNAGIAFRRPIHEVEPAEFDQLMAVNLRGVFFAVQAALRALVPRGAGSIVNVASTSSFTASTGPMAAAVAFLASDDAVSWSSTAAGAGLTHTRASVHYAHTRPRCGHR